MDSLSEQDFSDMDSNLFMLKNGKRCLWYSLSLNSTDSTFELLSSQMQRIKKVIN